MISFFHLRNIFNQVGVQTLTGIGHYVVCYVVKNFSISFLLRNEAETQNGKLEGARCTEQKTLEDNRKENKFSPHSS